MNMELLKAVIGLIQQGGWFALGGVALWGSMQLIKVCLVVFLIKGIATLIYRAYSNYISLKVLHRGESLTLLSEEVSEKLSADLEQFRQSTQDAMRGFLTESESILKQFKDTGKKPRTKK